MLAHPRTARRIAPPKQTVSFCLRHICGRQKCGCGNPPYNVTSRTMVPTQLDQSGARRDAACKHEAGQSSARKPAETCWQPVGAALGRLRGEGDGFQNRAFFSLPLIAACRNFGPPVDAYPGAPGLWRDRGKLRCWILSASLIEKLLLNRHKSHSSLPATLCNR